VGLTADFRQRPIETIRAHVSYLLDVLERAQYESLLYLSSTRVYAGSQRAREEEDLRVNPCDASDLYNLSKLTGEAACMAFADQKVRIARLSNVYGVGMDPVNFLGSLIQSAVTCRKIPLDTSFVSAKDYVWVVDVAEVLPRIAVSGRHRLYNVAAGHNLLTGKIVEMLTRLTGCSVDMAENAQTTVFPQISTSRIREEFGFSPKPLDDVIEQMVAEYKRKLTA
jgi:nucleoside-diphosphate-sugar epimerase